MTDCMDEWLECEMADIVVTSSLTHFGASDLMPSCRSFGSCFSASTDCFVLFFFFFDALHGDAQKAVSACE